MKSRGRYQESRPRSGAQWRGHINKAYNEPLRTSIETRRLILRPFESGHVETAFAWLGEPIVMRFTPTGPDTSIEQTKARLANYQEHQTEHGFRSGSSWIVTCAVRLGIRDCSRCKNTIGSTWASASANNCSRSIAVDGTGRIMFTENGKQDCGHAWNPESTFVSPALP